MFGWVGKVVPQPPVPSGNLAGDDASNSQTVAQQGETVTLQMEARKEAGQVAKSSKTKDESTEVNNTQGGMMTWLSSGIANALPQPTTSPQLSKSAMDTREAGGVIGWIAQEVGKVIPQPDEKLKEPEKAMETRPASPENVTEDIPNAKTPPQIPVVEVLSERESSEVDNNKQPISPRVLSWLKHSLEKVIPQPPEVQAPVNTEAALERENQACSSAPAVAPTPASPPATTPPLDADLAPSPAPEVLKMVSSPEEPPKCVTEEAPEPNMVNWIFQELSRRMPQPVFKRKDGAADGTEAVQNGGRC